MAEYIEREAISEKIRKYYYKNPPNFSYGEGFDRGLDRAQRAILDAPAADVEPVRHGRWIKESDGGTRCSVCNKRVRDVTGGWDEPVDLSDMPYCPKCGARMNEEADHAKE